MDNSDYKLSPQEQQEFDIIRREKTALKKGSVQLPNIVWNYLEKKSMPGILSVAAIVRSYVFSGIKTTIISEIGKLTLQNIYSTSNGIIAELGTHLALREKLQDTDDYNNLKKRYTDRQFLFKYFNENPEAFEEAKKSIIISILDLTDAELIGVISTNEY